MTDILIRDVDVKTVQRLKAKAKRNGRSLQSEVTQILREAAGLSNAEAVELGAAWRKRLGKRFDDSAAIIREDRAR